MSVDSTHISETFLMDNKTKDFTFSFAALKAEPTSVKARKLNLVNPNTYSTLVYDTDYTVAVNAEGSGGIVTLVSSAGTDKLFVYRETNDIQETDYTDFNQFPADTLEHDLDRRTMRSQEENDGVSRAVQFDISSSISGITLPAPVNDLGIKWSGTAGDMVNTQFPPDSAPSLAISAMTIAMASATASSISSVAAASQAEIAATWASVANTWESIAHTWSNIAGTQATLAASSATAAAQAMMTVPVITITTTAQINMATIGTLNVGTSATIENATIATLHITSAATANMMDAASLTAGNLLVTSTATIAALTATTVNISSGTIDKEVNIEIAQTTATPTFTTQQHFNNLFGSSGRATGGGVSSAGTASVHVSAGTGFIKATDDDTATLMSFNFASASSISVATNTTTYVYVDYNSGVPTLSTTTVNESWDLDTAWPLATVVQEGGKCHILCNPWWVTDGMTNLIERWQALGDVIRDANFGGMILSSTVDRRIAVTAGRVWSRLNEYSISALATNSSIEMYWRTTSTIWTDSDVTTLSSIYYNDLNTNTLETLTNNRYFNWWVYSEANDGATAIVFPQAQYVSAAAAEAEAPPTSLPSHIQEFGILIGRVIMKQGTTAPIQTDTAFETTFSPSQAADHGNLSGLADDDHAQYVAVTGTRSATIPTLSVTTSATIEALSVASATITNLTVGTVQITNMDTVTVGSITVTTDATFAMATATALTVSNIEITAGLATALTITSVEITGGAATGLTATTINITGGFATALSVATLSNVTAATIGLLTAGTITVGGSLVNPDISKAICVTEAVSGDTLTMFKVPSACTITSMYAVVTGTTPSAQWLIKHGTDRSAGGPVNTAGTTTTDITTGDTVTVFSDATIVANSWVWLYVPTVTGTVDTLNVTLNYRMDA